PLPRSRSRFHAPGPPLALPGRALPWRSRRHVRLPVHPRARLLLRTTSTGDPTMKKKVLFVCIHNSARSQMAEAFLNQICAGQFEAHSAGIEPGKLNPIVVAAMRQIGTDISDNQTKSADS